MPDDGANGGDVKVEVNDRRRFTPEGELREAEGSGEAAAPVADDRDQRLAAAEARVDELLRAYAGQVEEQKAARARMEREKQRVLDSERGQVAQALLESMDELERALTAAGMPEPGTPLAAVADGVRLSLAALAKRVSEMGAQRLSLLGERFDPHVAEAVDLVPVSDASRDQIVVEELRPAYRIGDRVLRAGRVRVGRLVQA
jgi:molecular chaperone GrpE